MGKLLAIPKKPLTFFCIGDTHFPFHNREALKLVIEKIRQIQPTIVLQLGDLLDQYNFSRFAKKNLVLPERELMQGRHFAERMWEAVQIASPNSLCYQLLGNHCVRAVKRAQERMPEAQSIVERSMLELYTFPRVKLIPDDREELRLMDMVFMHGFRSKLGDHMKYNHKNTIHGHTHRGGVYFEKINDKILWELDCGFLADENSEPLRYSPQRTTKWTLGFGLIREEFPGIFTPTFVPLR